MPLQQAQGRLSRRPAGGRRYGAGVGCRQSGAFAHLSTEFGLTQEEIGKRVGASRETVSNYLRLLKLPVDVQNFLSRGDLTYSHARELLVLHDESQISKLAQLAVKKRMSV